MVLFLFVIMLLNLRKDEFGPEKHPLQRWTARLFAIIMVLELILIIARGFMHGARPEQTAANFGDVQSVAVTLFTRYVLPFEMTSILLIVAIIGAIVLAQKRSGEGK
jgi:NADH-quinone oxidoreductase subunit J